VAPHDEVVAVTEIGETAVISVLNDRRYYTGLLHEKSVRAISLSLEEMGAAHLGLVAEHGGHGGV
jgi:hypothetical protein